MSLCNSPAPCSPPHIARIRASRSLCSSRRCALPPNSRSALLLDQGRRHHHVAHLRLSTGVVRRPVDLTSEIHSIPWVGPPTPCPWTNLSRVAVCVPGPAPACGALGWLPGCPCSTNSFGTPVGTATGCQVGISGILGAARCESRRAGGVKRLGDGRLRLERAGWQRCDGPRSAGAGNAGRGLCARPERVGAARRVTAWRLRAAARYRKQRPVRLF